MLGKANKSKLQEVSPKTREAFFYVKRFQRVAKSNSAQEKTGEQETKVACESRGRVTC